MMKYILQGITPVQCDDVLEWARWFETADTVVAQSWWPLNDYSDKRICVSTVFLALDHNWTGSGPPKLFETMVFGGKLDGYQVRSCTWAEAVETHKRVLERVKPVSWWEELKQRWKGERL